MDRSDSGNRFTKMFFLMSAMLVLIAAPFAMAQVTTGSISGSVTADDGSALPGVTLEIVHVPTGTTYTAYAGENGRFLVPNVRIGGPYKITGTLDGFQTAEVGGIQVQLGAIADVPVTMRLATVSEVIVVTADADALINPNRTGAATQVSTETIESLPTVNRSLQDFARTNPYFVVDAQDFSSTRLYVAGKNNRYNSIQIDGAVNNDLFGLADTGTPGGQTDAQPISLDAIEQLQLVVSPYDVRQGGFTGGGINVVTRSGSNNWDGSLFYSDRSESLVGDGPFDSPVANFNQTQYGGRLGGPILRDKLFFFVSGEMNRREQPTGWSADGSTGQVYSGTGTGSTPSASLFRDILISKYGYDPGSLGDFPAQTDSDTALLKFDWIVNSKNNLTLRHNYVDALRDVWADRSTSRFRFDTAIYGFASETNSTVAQLNSVFSANAFNEARVGYQTINDERAVGVIFPSVEIGGTGQRSGALHAGTERFSGANALDQTVLEIHNDFTYLWGNHTLTIGTHNEIFEFSNLFMSDFYGYYYFRTLDDFNNGVVNAYSITFANGSDPRRATEFKVGQYGLYASDQWRVNNNFTLTYGVRMDMPDWMDTPSYNPVVDAALGLRTDATASDDPIISPRIGFNWDPTGNGKQQIRGGIGIFAGRTPYVWISNSYGNTGIEQTALSCTGSCAANLPFNPDPFNQPRNVGAGGSQISVDVTDPDFELPHVMRATLGYDTTLPWDIRTSVELVWTETQQDVYYTNENKVQVGVSALDGRPRYGNVASNIRDAILLTNTSKGEQLAASLTLNKRVGTSFNTFLTYAWQDAKSAFDGTSSRAISNWQFHHTKGDIFTPELSRSAFEIENRFNVGITWDARTGSFTHNVGVFYNAQSGRPYSLMMGGDPNGDLYTTNDLLFIPAGGISPTSPVSNEKWIAYLESLGIDPSAGRILDRYELTEPWTQQVDLSYQLGLPEFVGVGTRLEFDILNLGNLIDNEWGVVEFVGNQNYTPVVWTGMDANGLPIYRENFSGSLNPRRQYSTADNRSRWQMRLGIRFNF
jgi:hypothetical protein